MTSSTATEKSVRFNDRDFILSTPEPCLLRQVGAAGRSHWLGLPTDPPGSARPTEDDLPDHLPGPEMKVKSILKSEAGYHHPGGSAAGYQDIVPDVTSFLLDREDGTLV